MRAGKGMEKREKRRRTGGRECEAEVEEVSNALHPGVAPPAFVRTHTRRAQHAGKDSVLRRFCGRGGALPGARRWLLRDPPRRRKEKGARGRGSRGFLTLLSILPPLLHARPRAQAHQAHAQTHPPLLSRQRWEFFPFPAGVRASVSGERRFCAAFNLALSLPYESTRAAAALHAHSTPPAVPFCPAEGGEEAWSAPAFLFPRRAPVPALSQPRPPLLS